jgi:cytochrome oxidase assembly protein ShyY1
VLPDGTALLVDRGWIPPAPGGATAEPVVPPAPGGDVTVTGRVHLPESRPGSIFERDGRLDVRRISPAHLATHLPYPVYGGYVTMDAQQPPADTRLVPIPADHENALMNAGYVVQWWMFAALTVVGLIWAVRRDARRDPDDVHADPGGTAPDGTAPDAGGGAHAPVPSTRTGTGFVPAV